VSGDVGAAASLFGGFEVWALELLPRLRQMVGARYGVPVQDCDDVVQTAVLDFLLQARKYSTIDPGLLVVITRRRCVDYLRSQEYQARKTVSLDVLPENDPRLVHGDAYAQGLLDGIALAMAWLKITPRCQQLLRERFFRQVGVDDLARRLGEHAGALKRYMSRCLARLRSMLAARV
jgi:RNA polymerase sigma factor (sigma-70 family)